jgi:carbamoyltransferase
LNARILQISPYYKPHVSFGGPVFSVSALCRALAQNGAEVTVYTIGYDTTQTYPSSKIIDGVKVWYFKSDGGHPCQVSLQLWRALKHAHQQFDVVHVHTWWNILIFNSIRILKGQGVPVVLSPRGMLSTYSFSHRKTVLKQWFQAGYGKWLMNGIGLHATAVAEAADIAQHSCRPIDTIYKLPNLLGLRQQVHDAPAHEAGYSLGFLSRLHHKKGIEILLRAVAITPQVHRLVIGGGGDPEYEVRLHQLTQALGIAHKVQFVGWVDDAAKPAFFSQFQVFILPSFNENFANVVAEAWAAGKPVIISTEVGLSDYFEHNDLGWLCKPDVQSVANAMVMALEGKARWPEMQAAALQLVAASFSDETMVLAYETMYGQQMAPQKRVAKAAVNLPPVAVQAKCAAKVVLGINAYHADASAAILVDGRVVAAVEEERFTRVKHWSGFPRQAIDFCLKTAGVDLNAVDIVAIGRDPKAKLLQKALFAMQHPSTIAFAVKGRLNNAETAATVLQELAASYPAATMPGLQQKVQFVEHHRSHLASAFYASDFTEAALISIDGSGDFTTTMMGVARKNKVGVLQSVDFPHSLGIFYTAFTQLLGFPHYGDEYKLMGLAPYGEPIYAQQVEQVVLFDNQGGFTLDPKYFRPAEKGYINYSNTNQPEVPRLYSAALEALVCPARQKNEPPSQLHKDVAASVQQVAEQTIFYLLKHLHAKTGLTNLCIAGGVAQNSVANGKIIGNTPFTSVFVPPAGHDAGLSVGAAYHAYHHHMGPKGQRFKQSAYSGTCFDNVYIEMLLKDEAAKYRKYLYFEELCNEVVNWLTQGAVVGWFRGRAEFGPRALGNRSILADPRGANTKQTINEKIKRRESFRPFAPSVLLEDAATYFEISQELPYMEMVVPVIQSKRDLLPAVTHVDGTARVQTVSKEQNPDYYQLISCFKKKTGIPILLNTSFNENEPIVNLPEEALNCFLRTRMDILVLEDFIISRPAHEL